MERRLTPFNGHVAHESLRGQVEAAQFVPGDWHRIAAPVADLLDAPAGRRDRQMLRGWRFRALERRDGMTFGQSERDGYVGWITESALGPDIAITHRIAAAGSHLYSAADLKSPERAALSLGVALAVTGTEGRFARVADGWVPLVHLVPADEIAPDPVAEARKLLGTPYLWGGNSREGIDCSGLVQAGCLAAGIACPGDSDMQMALGRPLDEAIPRERGDLWFWKGHVGILSDAETLLHANAHAMAVTLEPLDAAVARIAAQGDGPVTARRRLPLSPPRG